MPASHPPLPPTSDPFAVLGLPRAFDLDPAAIDRAYLAKSALAHPDLAAAGAETALGLDPDSAAAEVNHAKRILSDPESRAGALLALLGGPGKDADRALPPGFLAEMMETREQIESETASKDPGALRKWEAWASDRRSAHEANVAALFRTALAAPDPTTLRAIRLELNAWRYIERLLEQLDPDRGPVL